jgi:hypothetical protein
MLLLLGVALALNQQVKVEVQTGSPRRREIVVRDSAGDSTRTDTSRHVRIGYRRPVTAEVLATAFKDPVARQLLLRARAARLDQDSALRSYDAKSYERLSVGMGIGHIGRDHLLYRHESAGRVRWQRGVGVWSEVTGARTAIPMAPPEDEKQENHDDLNDADLTAPVPYYPGYEPLWISGSTVRAQVDESDIVHPLATGAEAYYTYETGDSIAFRLPDGSAIHLRELKIRPRQPAWNLAIGSFWFDTRTGQLVRAAYRLAVPIEFSDMVKSDTGSGMPAWLRPMFGTINGQITAIAIEYGLYDGRFWLPRLRSMDASAQVAFMHVPFNMEESFTYNSVNGPDSLPPIVIDGRVVREADDSLGRAREAAFRDSLRTTRRKANQARRDSVHAGLLKAGSDSAALGPCDSSGFRVQNQFRFEGGVPVAVRIPCDEAKLATSADLPKSIYGPDEALFGAGERDALVAQALSLGAQPPIQFRLGMLPPPTVVYGPELMRYNRVEGFSAGASADEQIGGGYDVSALGRFGFADHEPNVELTAARTNLAESIHLSGYNHLVSASDWGHPLSFGSSVSALLFGRDEGFYYRASGLELGGERDASLESGAHVEWRAFVEEERTAAVNTNFAVDGADFPANLVANRAWYKGVGLRIANDYGLDPRGFMLSTDLRAEAADGDSAYGRAALDVTASHGFGRLAGALTLAGGSSVGALPAQRRWYLGGVQTIRGQSPDTAQSGNAFWMARAELGTNGGGVRPTVFSDLGWVGDRSRIAEVGRPMSGVGAGLSFMDGLMRFDVARGLYPRRQYRVDLYLDAKF